MGKNDPQSGTSPSSKGRPYLYESSISVEDDEDVKIRVEFPGTGTTGYTLIRTYPDNDKNILNEGEAVIGKGGEIKEKGARISISPVNIAPNEDFVRVNVYVNNGKIVSHSNPKSECSDPLIRIKLSITVLLIIFCSAVLHGQTELSKLTAPSSPASYILGLQPSSVLQPKTFQALEAGIYSGFSGNNGSLTVPENFSLEFSPYWAMDEKASIKDYLFPDIMQSVLQSASFSASSTHNFIVSDSVTSKAIGFGFRAAINITGGSEKKNILSQLNSLNSVQKLRNIIVEDALEFYTRLPHGSGAVKKFTDTLALYLKENEECAALFENEKIGRQLIRAFVKKLSLEWPDGEGLDEAEFINWFLPLLDDFLKTAALREKLELFVRERPGFNIDFGAAFALGFPTDQFSLSYIPKKSLWITPSYSASEKLKFLIVLRYSWYNTRFYELYSRGSGFYKNCFDYGAGLSLSFKKFSLSLETSGRSSSISEKNMHAVSGEVYFLSKSRTDIQYMAALSYNVSGNVVLCYNLGRQFDPVLKNKGELISALSINFGFGGPTTENITMEL